LRLYVSRVLFARASKPARTGDHFSGIRIAADLKRPTRGDFVAPEPALPAYLVLLPVGFAVPFVSPRTRCALTAPFHPYSGEGRGTKAEGRTGSGHLFRLCHLPFAFCPPPSGIFLLHFPSGYPAWTLSSTVSCAVRTFLIPIKRLPGRDRRDCRNLLCIIRTSVDACPFPPS